MLLWFTRRQFAGKMLVTLGFLWLALLGYGAVGDALLRPLEYRYPPLHSPDPAMQVKWVVVLGGGAVSDPRLPATSQIAESCLVRLVEGIRLHRMIPESKLLLSGGTTFDPVPVAHVMADVARALGVNEENLVMESLSQNTAEEARLVQKMVKADRFILVTSASHIPRSMALFEKLGMRPIPAPTGHTVRERGGGAMNPGRFFPSPEGIRHAQIGIYEQLGLAWARLIGEI
jgi:uncharacterized SAM-binding protein YcdF (DUF218 family)